MEYTDLITELAYCRGFSSFWRSVAPACDLFVRRMNLDGYSRVFSPMVSGVRPERRGFINEVAFQLTSEMAKDAASSAQKIPGAVSLEAAVALGKARLFGANVALEASLTTDERADIFEQASRITKVFGGIAALSAVEFNPSFAGCGIVDQCFGDILSNDTLYEIKAGDRPLRSIDIKQLITYACLNFARSAYNIKNLGLFNPRVGILYEISVDQMSREISGRAPAELFADIVYHLSSGEISR